MLLHRSDFCFSHIPSFCIAADTANARVLVLSPTTGLLATFAGDGRSGFALHGAKARNTTLSGPVACHVDDAYNVYIADSHRVLRVERSSLRIVSFAGTDIPGYSGDGFKASASQLWAPMAFAPRAYAEAERRQLRGADVVDPHNYNRLMQVTLSNPFLFISGKGSL